MFPLLEKFDIGQMSRAEQEGNGLKPKIRRLIEADDIRIHNMHGPTVYAVDKNNDFQSVIDRLEWLNRPQSNAGHYRLIITLNGERFEIVPLDKE